MRAHAQKLAHLIIQRRGFRHKVRRHGHLADVNGFERPGIPILWPLG